MLEVLEVPVNGDRWCQYTAALITQKLFVGVCSGNGQLGGNPYIAAYEFPCNTAYWFTGTEMTVHAPESLLDCIFRRKPLIEMNTGCGYVERNI